MCVYGENSSDAELLEAFVQGKEGAFVLFMQRHFLPLRRWLSLSLTEDADIDDAVQETFKAVIQSAESFQGQNARAWVFGIGRRKVSRLFRRRAGEPEHFSSLDELALRAGWGDPESILDQAEEREVVRRNLRRLDPEAREILVLRDIEEFSTLETAEILGLPVPAVKSRLHRARLKLLGEIRNEEVRNGA